jgi:hypothetical protein
MVGGEKGTRCKNNNVFVDSDDIRVVRLRERQRAR